MMNKYILILCYALFFSCNSNNSSDNQNKINRQIELIPEPDLELRLAYQKLEIDSTLIKGKKAIKYVEKNDNQKPIKIRQEDEEIENEGTQYLIYQDTNNNIRAIIETPFSQSGDWYLETIHYFDKKGQICAFQKQLNTFHHADICGEELALCIKTIEYFDKGISKSTIKKVQNSKGIEFKEGVCSYQDIKTPIFLNLVDWAKSSKIDL